MLDSLEFLISAEEASLYQGADGMVDGPLDCGDILRAVSGVSLTGTRWVVIGGAAVALHLNEVGCSHSSQRCSFDVDLAVTALPRTIRGERLLGGGLRTRAGSITIDYMTPRQALSGMYMRMISRHTKIAGIPIAAPGAVSALKLANHCRPKDVVDVRLLVNHGLVTRAEIERWISLMDEGTSRRALRQLQVVLPL